LARFVLVCKVTRKTSLGNQLGRTVFKANDGQLFVRIDEKILLHVGPIDKDPQFIFFGEGLGRLDQIKFRFRIRATVFGKAGHHTARAILETIFGINVEPQNHLRTDFQFRCGHHIRGFKSLVLLKIP
jgi:hypothetical protein